MNILINLAKNTVARSTTEIINRASSAIFWICITRYLGAAGLGTMALSLSLLSVFSMIATLGLGTYVVREISKNRDKGELYFSAALFIGAAGTAAAILLLLIFTKLMNYEAQAMKAVVFIALTLPPIGVLFWSKSVLLGYEKMEYIAYTRFIENIFKVFAGVTLLILGYGVMHLLAVVLISKTIGALLLFSFMRAKTQVRRFRIDGALLMTLARNIPVFFSTTLFNSMFWSAPIIIVSKTGGLEAAGIYSAAYKLVDILLCFSAAFGQAVFPILARLSKESRDLFRTVCLKSIKFITIFTIAIATGGTLLAEKLIIHIYGEGMIASAGVLQILIWSIVPFGLVPLLAYTLISMNLQKFDMISNFNGFISVWALNITLIIFFGYIGAAVATLAATTIFALSQLYYVNIKLFNIGPIFRCAKLLPAAAFMAAYLLLFKNAELIVAVPLGAVIYTAGIFATGMVNTSDKQLYRQLRSF